MPAAGGRPDSDNNTSTTTSTTTTTTDTNTTNTAAATNSTTDAIPPALPAPGEVASSSSTPTPTPTTVLQVDGKAVALDHLGPAVVGRDGTVSRIANWGEMTEHERLNTLRVLGRRNQLRLAALRGEGQTDGEGGDRGA